jgi:hypothetical protein
VLHFIAVVFLRRHDIVLREIARQTNTNNDNNNPSKQTNKYVVSQAKGLGKDKGLVTGEEKPRTVSSALQDPAPRPSLTNPFPPF